MNYFIRDREYGHNILSERKQFVTSMCTVDMELCEEQPNSESIASPLQSLRIERNEWRFLLCGCAKGTVPIYDMEGENGHKAVGVALRGAVGSGRHTKGVCMADWYCVDNGIFNVGSFDGSVGVWDANAMECVHLYQVSDCVNVIASGVSPQTSALILAATKSDYLRLLDIRQEANTHCLMGHREQVLSAAWSPKDPHQLVTGDIEGCCFVWDIRRPSPLSEVGSQKAPQIRGALSRSLSAPLSKKSRLYGPNDADRNERRVQAILNASAGVAEKVPNQASAHRESVSGLSFSGDGNSLYSFSLRDSLKVWDASNGWQLLQTLDSLAVPASHPFMRMDVAVSLDPFNRSGRVLVGQGLDLCSVPIGASYGDLIWWPAHTRTVCSVEYNSRTHQAYSGGQDSMLHVWDHRGQRRRSHQGNNGGEAQIPVEENDNWSE